LESYGILICTEFSLLTSTLGMFDFLILPNFFLARNILPKEFEPYVMPNKMLLCFIDTYIMIVLGPDKHTYTQEGVRI